jgi:hypothetical protein
LGVVREIAVPGNVVMALAVDSTGKFVWTSTTDRSTFIFIYSTEVNMNHKYIILKLTLLHTNAYSYPLEFRKSERN